MATETKTCDVFLSHSSSDRDLADKIAVRLETAGLESFYDVDMMPGKKLSTAIWEALAECRAFVVIISVDPTPDAMGMVEIGAAAAWNKPIYVLLNGPSSVRLPGILESYNVYPLNRLDDVIHKIRMETDPLDDNDREILVDIYKDLSVSADQLGQSPNSLRTLTTRFNAETSKHFAGNRLLSELLRLRKKKKLPRLRR